MEFTGHDNTVMIGDRKHDLIGANNKTIKDFIGAYS